MDSDLQKIVDEAKKRLYTENYQKEEEYINCLVEEFNYNIFDMLFYFITLNVEVEEQHKKEDLLIWILNKITKFYDLDYIALRCGVFDPTETNVEELKNFGYLSNKLNIDRSTIRLMNEKRKDLLT